MSVAPGVPGIGFLPPGPGEARRPREAQRVQLRRARGGLNPIREWVPRALGVPVPGPPDAAHCHTFCTLSGNLPMCCAKLRA